MALTKEIVPGSIEIFEEAQMQVREDTVIKEDGKELSRTFMRTTLSPGDDVTKQSSRVQTIASLLWTPEVIEAWKANHPPLPPATFPVVVPDPEPSVALNVEKFKEN